MYNNANISPGHILVASSNREDYELIRSHFEDSGYVIERCNSLRDIYMTDLSPYNIVLMELTDNIDEGLHAIESIKRNSGPAIPQYWFTRHQGAVTRSSTRSMPVPMTMSSNRSRCVNSRQE